MAVSRCALRYAERVEGERRRNATRTGGEQAGVRRRVEAEGARLGAPVLGKQPAPFAGKLSRLPTIPFSISDRPTSVWKLRRRQDYQRAPAAFRILTSW